jgi:hypothetical protein
VFGKQADALSKANVSRRERETLSKAKESRPEVELWKRLFPKAASYSGDDIKQSYAPESTCSSQSVRSGTAIWESLKGSVYEGTEVLRSDRDTCNKLELCSAVL